MTVVRMPDGTNVDFGNLPPDQIRTMIQRKFPDAASILGHDAVSQPTVAQDIARSAPSALGRGALSILGAPGDISELALRGYDYLTGSPSASPEEMEQRLIFPTSREVIRGYEGATGVPFTRAQTDTGRVVESALEVVPAAATMGGGLAAAARQGTGALVNQMGRNAVQYGALPMGASEMAGQATEGTPLEPVARIGAAVAASIAPGAISRAITPFPSDPTRQANVRKLEQSGVKSLTAGQKTGNRSLQYMESEIGGQRASDMLARQADEFTQAALSRAGIYGERATPEVMSKAYREIGDEFDTLARNNAIIVDDDLAAQIGQAAQTYNDLGPPPEKLNALMRFADRMDRAIDDAGIMSGEAYQALRSDIGKAAKASNTSDPAYAQTLREFQNAIDDAMERSMAVIGSPDLDAWRNVRQRYKDFLVIERAASGPGAVDGLITPAQLRMAEQNVGGRRNYVLGRNSTFGDMSRAGHSVMRPLPNSGTAERLRAQQIPTMMGGGVGLLAGGGDAATALAGAVAGNAIPGLMGRAIMSRPGQAYLGNQMIRSAPRASLQGSAIMGLGLGRDMMTPQGPMIGLPDQYDDVTRALLGQ